MIGDQNDVQDLHSRVRDIERRLQHIPVRPASVRPALVILVVGQGNDIRNGATYLPVTYGLAFGDPFTASPITTVASAAPSAGQFSGAAATLPTFLCAAKVWTPTGAGSQYVWLASVVKPGASNIWSSLDPFEEGAVISSAVRVSLPISGGGGASAQVYLPYSGA